jgi:hypothetical protein
MDRPARCFGRKTRQRLLDLKRRRARLPSRRMKCRRQRKGWQRDCHGNRSRRTLNRRPHPRQRGMGVLHDVHFLIRSPAAQSSVTEARIQIRPFDGDRDRIHVGFRKTFERSRQIAVEAGLHLDPAFRQGELQVRGEEGFKMKRRKTACQHYGKPARNRSRTLPDVQRFSQFHSSSVYFRLIY